MQMQRTQGNRATQAYVAGMVRKASPVGHIQRETPEERQERITSRMEVGSGVLESTSESFGKPSEDLKQAYDKNNDDTASGHKSAGVGAVSSAADMISGPFAILINIRNARKTTGDTSTTQHNKNWNHANQAMSGIEGAGKTFSGASGLVDKAAKTKGSLDGVGKSGAVSDYGGTVADALSAVKSCVATAKSIYDMYSKYHEQGGLSKTDVAKGVIETVGNAVQAAAAIMKTAKDIMDIMQVGIGALATAIPGVSIAISGVKVALKTVDVIKAGLSRAKMTIIKREFKEKNQDVLKARKWYTRNDGVDKEKLAAKRTRLEQLQMLAQAQGANGSAKKYEAQIAEIDQYILAKEMKNINVKRQTRAGIQIGLELTKIAGDVATLTGVGAQVGTPLKIVASGVGAAMPVVRTLKQMGRDRAAKQGGLAAKIFNAEKSTENKKKRREQDADRVLDMIGKLPEYTKDDDSVKEQYQRVQSYVEAAGVSWYIFEKMDMNTDQDMFKDKLIEAMAQRE
jgi:hypothetical protein